jgi:hypothetical protein
VVVDQKHRACLVSRGRNVIAAMSGYTVLPADQLRCGTPDADDRLQRAERDHVVILNG